MNFQFWFLMDFKSYRVQILSVCFFYRLENSENVRKNTDESQSELKAEMKGKVNALQKRLSDLDTLRLALDSISPFHFHRDNSSLICSTGLYSWCSFSLQGGTGVRAEQWEGTETEAAERAAERTGQQHRAAHTAAAAARPADGGIHSINSLKAENKRILDMKFIR